jgi:RNA polymerase sigma factor (sigma-70 family)
MSDKSNQKAERIALMDQYREFSEKLVALMIKQFGLKNHYREELISAAYEGLAKAASLYDFSRGDAKFQSYAYLCIRGKVFEHLRFLSGYTSRQSYRLAKALGMANSLKESENKENTNSGLAGVLDYAAKTAICIKVVDDFDLLNEARSSKDNSYLEQLELRDEVRLLRKIMRETLTPKEIMIIEKFYFEDKSLEEIAKLVLREDNTRGVVISSVSRYHHNALRKLKAAFIELRNKEGENKDVS